MPASIYFPLVAAIYFLLSSHSNVFAQSIEYGGFRMPGGPVTVGPEAHPELRRSQGQAVWDQSVKTDGGMPKVDGEHSARNPSGNPVKVKATARLPGTAVAKAVGKAIAKNLIPGVAVATAIKEVADELGFILDKKPDGQIDVSKSNPLATCHVTYPNNTYANTPSVTTTRYCVRTSSTTTTYSYGLSHSSSQFGWPGVSFPCGYKSCATGALETAGGTTPASNVTLGEPIPSTHQEFLDAIASKSGWPSSSAIKRVLDDSLTTGPVAVSGPITVSGPATSPGTSSQTQKADGNTETKTTTHNHNYAGNTVTTTTTTVINNYNPTTNITTTETTTGTSAPAEQDPADVANDTPLPELPKLYEPKYPAGPSKVWADRKADFMASPLLGLVTLLTPNIGPAGCPQFSLSLDLSIINFGVYNTGPPCYVWEFCAVVILVTALFLSRRLIFGG
jgi:hypothetical protein